MATITPRVESLVLDAGPLLSLSPLKGLSKSYFTVPQVLGELKDDKSRTHFQNLGLLAGVKVETRMPDSAALAQVTLAAKKTGDYTVLSVADLNVLALTYALHQEYSQKNSPESAAS
ncbi:Nin1 binding protein [Serendipita sp. 398]|nr:Nin1 binding protein [Serendipita sp. 398]